MADALRDDLIRCAMVNGQANIKAGVAQGADGITAAHPQQLFIRPLDAASLSFIGVLGDVRIGQGTDFKSIVVSVRKIEYGLPFFPLCLFDTFDISSDFGVVANA